MERGSNFLNLLDPQPDSAPSVLSGNYGAGEIVGVAIGSTGGIAGVDTGAIVGTGVIVAVTIGVGVGVGEVTTGGVSVREQPVQRKAANKPQAKRRRTGVCIVLLSTQNITGALPEHYDFEPATTFGGVGDVVEDAGAPAIFFSKACKRFWASLSAGKSFNILRRSAASFSTCFVIA